jgi:hypothetical protein
MNQWEVDFLGLSQGRCTNPSEANVEHALMGFDQFTGSKVVVDFGKNTTMPFPRTHVATVAPRMHKSVAPDVPALRLNARELMRVHASTHLR